MIRHRAVAGISIAIASMLAGCGPSSPGPARLRVAAASDLQQALPILQREALASQSAHIDSVSGATYTSEGYIQSLQSALDQR